MSRSRKGHDQEPVGLYEQIVLWLLPKTRYFRASDRRSVARIAERLFAPEWYAHRTGLPAGVDERTDYVARGAWIGLSPHPLIDPKWMARGLTLPRAIMGRFSSFRCADAVLRFVERERIVDPHPLFDTAWYESQIADTSDRSDVDPVTHYLLVGGQLGYSPHPLIDADILQREYRVATGRPDDGRSSPDAAIAYAQGQLPWARTHELFDSGAYLVLNEDVRLAGSIALEHYVRSGRSEGRATLHEPEEQWARIRWGVANDERFSPFDLAVSIGETARRSASEALERTMRRDLHRLLRGETGVSRPPWESSTSPDVCAIVPVWNQAHLALGSIRALILALRGIAAEIRVIDNGSTDETAQMLAFCDGVDVTRWEENHGFGAAVNHAASRTTAEFLLLVNSDAFIEPGTIEAALNTIRNDARCGAVCGRLILPNGALQEAGSYLLPDGSARGRLRGRPAEDPAALHVCDVDFGSAALVLIRRHAFEEVGGFSDVFGLAYGEDVDLMLLMRERGWSTIYEPALRATHLESASTRDWDEVTRRQQSAARLIRYRHIGLLAGRGRRPLASGTACQDWSARTTVVVIDDTVPDGRAGSGQPRAEMVLRALRRRHDVILLTARTRMSDEDRASWRAVADRIDRRIEVVPGLAPDQWVDWLLAERARVDCVWISRSHNMDAIRSELARRGLDRLPVPTIYDCEAFTAERDSAIAAFRGTPRADPDAASAAEIELARLADRTVCVSRDDAEQLAMLGGPEPLVLKHAIDEPDTSVRRPIDGQLLFVGRLAEDWSPNVIGLQWFLSEVWPRLASLPTVRLDVVGLGGAAIEWPDDDRILRHGRVDDVSAIYERAQVFIAPTFFGSGLALKVLEAASWGIPVITTPLIAGQLGWTPGRHLITADTGETFSREIVRLLDDARLRVSLSDAARRRVASDTDPVRFSEDVLRAVTLATADFRGPRLH